MSYLERLKRKILEDGARDLPTEPTKAPSVGFVGTPPGHPRQIHAVNDSAERTCEGCRHSHTFFTRTAAMLAGAPANDLHLLCREPVQAGLTKQFAIAYPPGAFAQNCPAWAPKIKH